MAVLQTTLGGDLGKADLGVKELTGAGAVLERQQSTTQIKDCHFALKRW